MGHERESQLTLGLMTPSAPAHPHSIRYPLHIAILPLADCPGYPLLRIICCLPVVDMTGDKAPRETSLCTDITPCLSHTCLKCLLLIPSDASHQPANERL